MGIAFWFCLIIIFYVYIGYFALLKFIVLFHQDRRISGHKNAGKENFSPFVSVIIAAHNEEAIIKARIVNILSQDYPRERLEIIIASDGSTDRTVEIARQFEKEGVSVLDFKVQRGRSLVHGDAVKTAKGEILVFTDAETVFERDFLSQAIRHFRDSKVGGVTGKLIYRPGNESIAQSEGLYFKYETKLRELESKLQILVAGSGACLLARKNLFVPFQPNEDVDVMYPLDCILKGYHFVFEPMAIAYDIPPSTLKAELNYRFRDTSLSFAGTVRKWKIKYWFGYPGVSLSILSHRILRWLTPYFMIIAFVTNFFLAQKSSFYTIILWAQILFYLSALIGWFAEMRNLKIPGASMIFSFCVANIGMMVGVMRAVLGKAPATYKMPD